MSAQPAEPGPAFRVKGFPKTINAIRDNLTPEKRKTFLEEVMEAEEGDAINTVLEQWWMTAMFDKVPSNQERYHNAVAGRNLISLTDLAKKLDVDL